LHGFGLTPIGHLRPEVGPLPSSIHQRWPATPESVGAARHQVRRFAADLEVDLDDVMLAVSEAVANAVTHAYAEGVLGHVELSAGASTSTVTVTVRDHGRGLVDGGGGPGAGFGLTLIRRLAQHVELTDTPEGVSLTMAFRRGGAASLH